MDDARMRARSQRDHAERAERTYAAASDHYRRPALGFWDRWGASTIDRIALCPGDAVLDVCCGAGASALPAAQAVGPSGSVLGLDLALPLLSVARQRSVDLGLSNVSFEQRDATATALDSESFDAVVCVFGVFFAADMPGFVRELWRLVRPGGTLAITTWGPDWCEPASGIFWEAVRRIDATLFRDFNPWDEITSEPALGSLLANGGVHGASVLATTDEYHVLDQPEDFWDIVLGSGLRATVDALDKPLQETLRRDVIAAVRERGITRLHNDVVLATAVKPAPRDG